MRIGIDAKWFFRGPPSGRRVVQNLVRSLAKSPGGDELHFFFDARARAEPLPDGIAESRRHYVWAENNQMSNVFVVPRAADRAGLDAVVYQNFVPPPPGVRHARIGFVHDVIFDSHPEFFTRRERLYFKPLRYLTSTADRVCTGSESERARLVRYDYASVDRIDVVPYAVDGEFVPRECLPAAAVRDALESLGVREPFVLYVGRLTARKNVRTLVRAMGSARTPGLELAIVGARDETCPDLAAIAESAGARGAVRFLGALGLDDDRVRALYAAAAVFCFPSLDEGFGLPPLEAMASGTPVVVSNMAATAEVCGDAAVYVDATDPAAIAGAIDALMTDPPRRAELRAAGLARAREFCWNESARRLLATARAAVANRA